MNGGNPIRFLKVPEMAREIGVSEEKVRTWCSTGQIPNAINIGDKVNRFFRVSEADWEAFKASRTVKPARPAPPRLRQRAGTNLLGI